MDSISSVSVAFKPLNRRNELKNATPSRTRRGGFLLRGKVRPPEKSAEKDCRPLWGTQTVAGYWEFARVQHRCAR